MYGKPTYRAAESPQLFDGIPRCISTRHVCRGDPILSISGLAASQTCFEIFFVSSSISQQFLYKEHPTTTNKA